jgi:general secretion pathway protein A
LLRSARRESRSTFLTYEPYYGLREKPFGLSADPRFLYKSPSHAAAHQDLLEGIRRREGLIVLTGDIGTGKTTLCHSVLQNLDRKTFSTFVPDPFVTREDLLRMLLIDFGVMSVDDLKSGRLSGASRSDLSYPLYEFLNSLVSIDAYAVLVIDEAQNLSVPLLEELRILSDLEVSEKLLQVVLIGQLEFQAKLKLPEMRQLDQRVVVRCQLDPLPRQNVAGYISHRLAVAGGGSDRIEFSDEAVEAIFQSSQGVPRLINVICDRALREGYLLHKPTIDRNDVGRAVEHLGIGALTPFTPPLLATPPLPAKAVKRQAGAYLSAADHSEGLEMNDLSDEIHASASVMLNGVDIGARPSSDTVRKTVAVLGETVAAERWERRSRWIMQLAAILVCVVIAAIAVANFLPDDKATVVSPAVVPAAAPLAVPASPPQAPASLPGPSVESPAAESLASEATYAVDIAVFSTANRANQLVEELRAIGVVGRVSNLDVAGIRKYLVLVGNYQTREAAETELVRIRQVAAFADARVIADPTSSAP